ncbi:MAG: hydantoinase/oxoprolinase family protein, partial [Alphaproteobacteria bacterium]|nr:hydantoinase/oxoprolinase family protein [Alphaproteobacteria bacterium]
SAGADPGPVAYGRGGTRPTITDCYLTLGILDPERFLGGRMKLDAHAARGALDTIAASLGLSGPGRAEEAAESALRVATAKMATELIKLMATAGVDPRDFALVAYGGAGPTHAGLLAEEAGLPTVLVPMAPGTFCALGAVLADVRRDYVRTARHLVGARGATDGFAKVMTLVAELERDAVAWVAKEGAIVGEHALVLTMSMRYPDQAYDLEVRVPEESRRALTSAALASLFHDEHARRYGFSEPTGAVQVTTIRLGVIGKVPPVQLSARPPADAKPRGHRRIRHAGREHEAAVYDRASLGEGAAIAGPAIIEQLDTTTFVPPGWRARADRIGTLHLAKETI